MHELEPVTTVYAPWLQVPHVLDPAVLYVPAAHWLWLVPPEHAYPASHVVHDDKPLTELYVPAVQLEHADAPASEYAPAAHTTRAPPVQ